MPASFFENVAREGGEDSEPQRLPIGMRPKILPVAELIKRALMSPAEMARCVDTTQSPEYRVFLGKSGEFSRSSLGERYWPKIN